MGLSDVIRKWDFYKKIPEDLTVSTMPGAYLSLGGLVVMLLLFVLELNAYLTTEYQTAIVMDEAMDEMLQINFNITIPDLRCELATLDVSDLTGVRRHNVTQNILKIRQDHKGRSIGVVNPFQAAPKYEEVEEEDENAILESVSLDESNFDHFLSAHHLVMVDFYAPWCIWCQRLAPVWEKTAKTLPTLHFGQRVRMAEVNCEQEANLCAKLHIRAYPTIYYFKDGKSTPLSAYMGDRTVDAFLKKTKDIIDGEQDPAELVKMQLHESDKQGGDPAAVTLGTPGPEGCQILGQLIVKRVPGNFHIHLSNPGFSVNTALANASHYISNLWFGEKLDYSQQRKLPSAAVDMANSHLLEGRRFVAMRENHTYVHYLKVVTHNYRLASGETITLYKYTAHSNEYIEEYDDPSVMFRYDLSPMSVEITPRTIPFYHFLTNICAIIGGVFTVLGLIDSVIHTTTRAISKKVM